ncbi:DUF2794 domain-containing protein [Rhodoligotrophos defluvii]|uniref:DUF2794 domain-containing protein n=1 Tax=Rhodoligotrophos defluvii TaxID=2561934 RepID=UPI0010C9708A|nr:DUF2794 domain-containing protein [Rhodoligotrophos defluvii]
MSDTEPIVQFGARASATALQAAGGKASVSGIGTTAFDRQELAAILSLYGRRVAEGAWRDYAIDHGGDKAVFSIFRRTSEVPLYRIEKQPKLRHKQGLYAIVAQTGAILRRGHDIKQVLKAIDRQPKLVSA